MYRYRFALLTGVVLLIAAGGCSGGDETSDPPTTSPTDDGPVTASPSAAAAEPATPDPADAVLGHWYTEDDDAQVVITKEDGVYGGKIVWLKNPTYDEEGDEELGQPRHDRNNPDEELQSRPIVGLSMIHGFTYNEDEGKWDGGSIYDPESGKTYKCQMTLGENDTLAVRGYIGIPMLGRDTVWRPVPEGEEKTAEEAAAPVPSA